MKSWKIVAMLFVCVLVLSGCSVNKTEGLQDGSYTAQMAEPSHGWQEFVTITVKNGKILSAEYNAENASGFIKSWDNAYMNNMKSVMGTYPNEYTRYYASFLIGQSEAPEIDLLAGASSSGRNFERLSQTVVEQAKKGDSTVALVQPLSEK